ncbi:hypothetical protein GE09DRAFT_1052318 [Coniochaeta sp. 2T2.1]|nr:hypothetical protein GE09DRAFT_1052318 [Coniochaeta sp. 2T2.1]
MSGVKNLRAMFEQKGDTSPPADDRGRSPGVGSTGTESPRPISRIRTNFIAIEKDGRLGLQRDNSRDSSVSGVSTRKYSGDLETPSLSRTTSHDNTVTSAPRDDKPDKSPMRRTSLKEQPIPESPRTDSSPQMPSLPLPKSPNGKVLAPPINPDKTVDEEEVDTKMKEGGPTDKSAVTGTSTPRSDKMSNGTNGDKDKGKGKAVAKEPSKHAASASKPAPKTVAPVNTASKTATKPTKSPTVSKPLKSPATAAPKLASKTPEKKAAHPEKTTAPKASSSTVKPATTSTSGPSSTRKPPPLQPSPASTGFVKPKVKSPTRPVKLPPGLTTHTAASATKFNLPRQSLPAGQTSSDAPAARSHSRASISTTATTRATAGTASKPLKRQSSTISRPRPSIGPPPKQASKDHPPTKKETHVDEGFLARMMRPTAASASKTHEKAPLTPPRKGTAAPAAAAAKKVEKTAQHIAHKVEHKLAHETKDKQDKQEQKEKHAEVQDAHTKHPLTKHPKPVARAAHPQAKAPAQAEVSAAEKIAPVVEKVATAEEVVEVAKKIDGPAALPEEAKSEEEKPVEAKEEAKPEAPKTEEVKVVETKPEEPPAQEEVKPQPTPQEPAQLEHFDEPAASIEAAEVAEDARTLRTDTESATSKHEIPPEQDEAPLEAEGAEGAPSEATLVEGAHDKTAVAPELAGAVDEAVKDVHAEEEKVAEQGKNEEVTA